jgi:hypothetical protein
MSINMLPRVMQEFGRVVDESQYATFQTLEAAGGAPASPVTVSNTRLYRVVTSSDSAQRGFTVVVSITEAATATSAAWIAGTTGNFASTDDIVAQ